MTGVQTFSAYSYQLLDRGVVHSMGLKHHTLLTNTWCREGRGKEVGGQREGGGGREGRGKGRDEGKEGVRKREGGKEGE